MPPTVPEIPWTGSSATDLEGRGGEKLGEWAEQNRRRAEKARISF